MVYLASNRSLKRQRYIISCTRLYTCPHTWLNHTNVATINLKWCYHVQHLQEPAIYNNVRQKFLKKWAEGFKAVWIVAFWDTTSCSSVDGHQRIGCTVPAAIYPVINPKEHKLSFRSYFRQQNECEKAAWSSNVSTTWGESTLLEFHSENYSWNVTSPRIYFTRWCKRMRYFYL